MLKCLGNLLEVGDATDHLICCGDGPSVSGAEETHLQPEKNTTPGVTQGSLAALAWGRGGPGSNP